MPKRRRKVGRPRLPADMVRDIRFEIRLSKCEVEKLNRAAQGAKLSTWLRDLALKFADSILA